MAEDLRKKRQQMPDQARHAADDTETARRRHRDVTIFRANGGRLDDRDGFFKFRLRQRGGGGPTDGADRYPEHTKPDA